MILPIFDEPQKTLQAVERGILKARVLKAVLGASVVFLLTYVLLMLFTLPTLLIALVISIVFLLSELVSFGNTPALVEAEGKYIDLHEALRTMKDTLREDNELTRDLRADMMVKIKRLVDLGDFIDFKQLFSRSLLVFFLSFSIIFLASLNINIIDGEGVIGFGASVWDDVVAGTREKVTVSNSEGNINGGLKKLAIMAGVNAGDQEGGEIFGDATVAQLGNERLHVEIRPTDFEVDIHNYESPEQKDFKVQPYEDDVFLAKSTSLEENIPEQQQIIVKRYFDQLAGGSS